MIKAVIFDAFGTLLDSDTHLDPYKALFKIAMKDNHSFDKVIARRVMKEPLAIEQSAVLMGFQLSHEQSTELNDMLTQHLASISLFPEVTTVLMRLQEQGIRAGVCSNLALPYGLKVKALLPALDAYTLSYERGAMKPEPVMYQHSLTGLGVFTWEALMIGDSLKCDKLGPQEVGIRSLYLNRGKAGKGDCTTLDGIFHEMRQ
jgi:FMN phosphatase YigB (HAD superfamily)